MGASFYMGTANARGMVTMATKKKDAAIYRRTQLTFRARAHEADAIRAAARAARVHTAEWIRFQLLKAARDAEVQELAS